MVTFNAPISLNFKDNFEISSIKSSINNSNVTILGIPLSSEDSKANLIDLSELDIDYFKIDSKIEWEQIVRKEMITVFPKLKIGDIEKAIVIH